MIRITSLCRCCAVAVAAVLAASTPVISQSPAPTAAQPARLIVRWQPAAVQAERGPVMASVDATLLGQVESVAGLEIWTVADADRALARLRGNPSFQYVEPDQRVRTSADPNDPFYSSQWGLPAIRAPQAWERVTSSYATIVAVIDSGVDYTHQDLAANMWRNPREIPGNRIDDDRNGFVDDVYGWDFGNRDADPMDDHGHGTHVAGTIGAVGNNGVGVAGVAWSCKIMALKFLNSAGSGWTSDAILALNYAVANGARISNNSWGGGGFSQGLRDAIGAAGARSHVFVAAAGNDGRDIDTVPFYPASYPANNIVSVAATARGDVRASFSNYGERSVDIAAPGVSIYSTLPGGRYGYQSGTSMAAPHVTGALALATSGCHNLIGMLVTRARRVASLHGLIASGGVLDLAWLDGGRFSTEFVTGLDRTGIVWDFDVEDWDRDGWPDLVGFRYSTTLTDPVQIHVLSGRSGFQRYVVNPWIGSGVSHGNWDYHFADFNRDGHLDLFGVLKNATGSGRTEVHILSGASSFQTPLVQIGTALQQTYGDWEFDIGDWDRDGIPDLIGIAKRNTGSGRTEVHVLSGRSTFQTFIVHQASVFGQADASWAFKMADWNRDGTLDLVGLKKYATGSNSTEIHVASGATGFGTWIHQTGSPLPETNADWEFELADWDRDGRPDLFAIHERNTASGGVELHIADMPHQAVLYYGAGCGASGTVPQLTVTPALVGSTYDAVVTGAVPSALSFLGRGTRPMGLDLAPFAPGCTLHTELAELIPVVADPFGTARLRMWIPPNPALIGSLHFHQFLIPDPRVSTPWQMSFTRAARTIIMCR